MTGEQKRGTAGVNTQKGTKDSEGEQTGTGAARKTSLVKGTSLNKRTRKRHPTTPLGQPYRGGQPCTNAKLQSKPYLGPPDKRKGKGVFLLPLLPQASRPSQPRMTIADPSVSQNGTIQRSIQTRDTSALPGFPDEDKASEHSPQGKKYPSL